MTHNEIERYRIELSRIKKFLKHLYKLHDMTDDRREVEYALRTIASIEDRQQYIYMLFEKYGVL